MGDDPTVNRPGPDGGDDAANRPALFFPLGDVRAISPLMSHCERGDEYIVGQMAHTYRWEGGGAAVLGSIQPQPIEQAVRRHDPDRQDRRGHQALWPWPRHPLRAYPTAGA